MAKIVALDVLIGILKQVYNKTKEYTKNQMLVNEQLSKGIKHDLSDVMDSLAVASGNAYVSGGVVKYRK